MLYHIAESWINEIKTKFVMLKHFVHYYYMNVIILLDYIRLHYRKQYAILA